MPTVLKINISAMQTHSIIIANESCSEFCSSEFILAQLNIFLVILIEYIFYILSWQLNQDKQNSRSFPKIVALTLTSQGPFAVYDMDLVSTSQFLSWEQILSSFKAFWVLIPPSSYLFIFVCAHTCVCRGWKATCRNHFSPTYVGPGNQSQTVWFGSKRPYPVEHLASPPSNFEELFMSHRRKSIFNKNFLSDLKCS